MRSVARAGSAGGRATATLITMSEEQSEPEPEPAASEFRHLPPRVAPDEMIEMQALVPPAESRPVGSDDSEWQLRAGGAG